MKIFFNKNDLLKQQSIYVYMIYIYICSIYDFLFK